MFYTGMLAGAAYGAFASDEGGLGGALKGAALGAAAGRYGPKALKTARAAPNIQIGAGYRAKAGISAALGQAKKDFDSVLNSNRTATPRSTGPMPGTSKSSKSSTTLRSNGGSRTRGPSRRQRRRSEAKLQQNMKNQAVANRGSRFTPNDAAGNLPRRNGLNAMLGNVGGTGQRGIASILGNIG